jgi:hypothetical protein
MLQEAVQTDRQVMAWTQKQYSILSDMVMNVHTSSLGTKMRIEIKQVSLLPEILHRKSFWPNATEQEAD